MSQTSHTRELQVLAETFDYTEAVCLGCMRVGIQASFLPEVLRNNVLSKHF